MDFLKNWYGMLTDLLSSVIFFAFSNSENQSHNLHTSPRRRNGQNVSFLVQSYWAWEICESCTQKIQHTSVLKNQTDSFWENECSGFGGEIFELKLDWTKVLNSLFRDDRLSRKKKSITFLVRRWGGKWHDDVYIWKWKVFDRKDLKIGKKFWKKNTIAFIA